MNCGNTNEMKICSFHLYSHSSHHFILCFTPFTNSINWPALHVWVFIAQFQIEHCSTNAEATGLNPVESPEKLFSGYFAIA